MKPSTEYKTYDPNFPIESQLELEEHTTLTRSQKNSLFDLEVPMDIFKPIKLGKIPYRIVLQAVLPPEYKIGKEGIYGGFCACSITPLHNPERFEAVLLEDLNLAIKRIYSQNIATASFDQK